MKNLVIKNAIVVDPKNSIEEKKDVYVENGVFVETMPKGEVDVIDAEGLHIFPGFVEIHCHLREPGQSYKETVATGTMAAAAGGYTSIIPMPNTNPNIDDASSYRLLKYIIEDSAKVNVYISACISEGRKGEKLAPIGTLAKLGAVAITDDGSCIQSNELMFKALEYASMFDILVMDHCQDASLTKKAQINGGLVSIATGLGAWENAGEDLIVSRNIILSKYTNARVHMQHLSSAYSVELIRNAKQNGIRVSGEASPHHISLSDENLLGYDTNFKMNPPLRTQKDIDAIIEGLCDGTIEAIATDHAPHSEADKDVEFDYAPFGIIGFETAFSVCYETLVKSGKMPLMRLVELLTSSPASLVGLDAGSMSYGKEADFCLVDLNEKYVYNKTYSLSKNSPWWNKELQAKVKATYLKGSKVF
ncbi:MAG: dihydroorotase [Opitutales bacterium]